MRTFKLKKLIVLSMFCSSVAYAQNSNEKLLGLSEIELINKYIRSSNTEKLFLGSGVTELRKGFTKYRLGQGGYFSSGTSMKGTVKTFKNWCISNGGEILDDPNETELSFYTNYTLYKKAEIQKLSSLFCKMNDKNFTWIYDGNTINQATSYSSPEKFIYVLDSSTRDTAIFEGLQLAASLTELQNKQKEQALAYQEKRNKQRQCLSQERAIALKSLRVGSKLEDGSLVIEQKNEMLLIQKQIGTIFQNHSSSPEVKSFWVLKSDLTAEQVVNDRKCRKI
ncbi:hypothetical protein [Hydromonas duriensis]|uniref:Uncharacterized protein n=1 Tax=Hydromonas duriensis TaxID=1527608 RepID=A0A4R6YAL5_9BURK|nr:hypothetical protein [Hydromonas duriensis]TDR32572.1 hypothetical protein DFR44_10385 [Hydromonas duriensis]